MLKLERNPTIDELAGLVLKLTDQMQRGQLLTYDEIQRATGLERGGPHWPSVMGDRGRVRRSLLRDRGIESEMVPGIGLRLLTVAEQGYKSPRKRFTRAGRQADKAVTTVASVLKVDQPLHQRRLAGLAYDLARQTRKQARSARGRLVHANRTPETLPRRVATVAA